MRKPTLLSLFTSDVWHYYHSVILYVNIYIYLIDNKGVLKNQANTFVDKRSHMDINKFQF